MKEQGVFAVGNKQIARAMGLGEKKIKTICKWEGCPVFFNEKGWPTVNVEKMAQWYEERCREMMEKPQNGRGLSF